jgi:hypothetical protein
MVDADGNVYVGVFRLTRMSVSDISLVWAESPELTESLSGPYTFADLTSLDATFESALQGFTAIGVTPFRYEAHDIHPEESWMEKDLPDKANPANRQPRTSEREMTDEEMLCEMRTRQLYQAFPITDRYPPIRTTAIIYAGSPEAHLTLLHVLGEELLVDFVTILMDPRNSHFVFRQIHHTQTNNWRTVLHRPPGLARSLFGVWILRWYSDFYAYYQHNPCFREQLLLRGTPGIGKSTFAVYLLFRWFVANDLLSSRGKYDSIRIEMTPKQEKMPWITFLFHRLGNGDLLIASAEGGLKGRRISYSPRLKVGRNRVVEIVNGPQFLTTAGERSPSVMES